MHSIGILSNLIVLITITSTYGQRITTIQLDGVQYFISRMNPYSPELNYFLAYQYCRSLGLQLASFETKEKADSITQYLTNAGYNKYDFWISGNKLGTDMYLWMSTGLPFNATFNYMRKSANEVTSVETPYDLPSGSTSPQRTARESGNGGLTNNCVTMKAPTFEWDTNDCTAVKDFICEQTRCYYYNYGSIPVSSAQGKPSTTTAAPTSTEQSHKYVNMGINELISKIRSTSVPHRNVVKDDADVEFTTNGPYDSFHSNVEMHDEPAAIVDRRDEDYASTIEPDTVTTFAGTADPSSY